ncbi:MAG: lysophospholipid acyltransferase family protein, partial [bacterium]
MKIIYYLKVFLIGLVTVIFGTLYFILILVDILSKNSHLYDFLSKIWSKLVLLISGIKVHIEGLENFNPNSNYVIAGNHLSLMDVPPLLYYFPGKLRYVFKKELGKIPIFGWVLKVIHIEVDRGNRKKSQRSFSKAKKKLKEGVSVIIFPEGTRSKTGEIQKFKKGAFVFSLQNKLDILPYAIYGTKEILPPNTIDIHSGEVFISFRKPISIKNYSFEDRNKLLEETRE